MFYLSLQIVLEVATTDTLEYVFASRVKAVPALFRYNDHFTFWPLLYRRGFQALRGHQRLAVLKAP